MEGRFEAGLATGIAGDFKVSDLEFEFYVDDCLGVNHSILNCSKKTKRDGGEEGRATIKRVLIKVKRVGHDMKEHVVARAVEVHSA